MDVLEAVILETAETWEQARGAGGEVRAIIGAVDETFLEQMMLVFMDLRTGYLLLEEVADDRPYATWKALVEERLTALDTRVRHVVSDREGFHPAGGPRLRVPEYTRLLSLHA